MRVRTQALAHAGLGAFWLGRAVGRRPNHCYNRWNRTNKTAGDSRLVLFALPGAGPAQIRHTPACVQAGSRVALPHG